MSYEMPKVVMINLNEINDVKVGVASCNCPTGKSTHAKFKRKATK